MDAILVKSNHYKSIWARQENAIVTESVLLWSSLSQFRTVFSIYKHTKTTPAAPSRCVFFFFFLFPNSHTRYESNRHTLCSRVSIFFFSSTLINIYSGRSRILRVRALCPPHSARSTHIYTHTNTHTHDYTFE